MQVFIKLSLREYEDLRRRIPSVSPAHQFLAKATRIDYSIEGVLFEGYSIPCNEDEAPVLLHAVRDSCPYVADKVEQAIRLAAGR